MKPKADTDNGWFKVANDLVEALVRADLTANEYAICLWIMAKTYGCKVKRGKEVVPQKTCLFSPNRMADDTGRDRKGIERSLEHLTKQRVISISGKGREKRVGISTKVAEWGCLYVASRARGRTLDMGLKTLGQASHGTGVPWDKRPGLPGTGVPPQPGQASQVDRDRRPGIFSDGAPERVRASVGDVERKERGEATAPPPLTLPNGVADTAKSRADLGNPELDPHESPDYARLDFDYRARLVDEWELNLYRARLARDAKETERRNAEQRRMAEEYERSRAGRKSAA